MKPDLLIWDLIASMTIGITLLFVCFVVAIFVMRSFLALIKKQPNPFLWLFLISPLAVFMILPEFGALYLVIGIPIFFLILIVQAFKWGRAREFTILFCCAAAVSIGFGIYGGYKQEYQKARETAARMGHPFPEDVTPLPQFDPAVGIPYRNADSIHEFEFVTDDTFNIRIPIISGLVLESQQKQGNSLLFGMVDPTSKYKRSSLWGLIRATNKAIEDPTMRKYIEEKYASLDIANVLYKPYFSPHKTEGLRETVYITRNAALIFKTEGDPNSSPIYKAEGIVGTTDTSYEFSFIGMPFRRADPSSTRDYVSDWAYAFIEANRVPDSAVGASAALPAQPSGPE